MHFARVHVHVIVLVVDVVCLMLVLSARVVIHAVVIAFPQPVFCSRRYTLYSKRTTQRWSSSLQQRKNDKKAPQVSAHEGSMAPEKFRDWYKD